MKKILTILILFFSLSSTAIAQLYPDMTIAPHSTALTINGKIVPCTSYVKFFATMNEKDIYMVYFVFLNKHVEKAVLIRHNEDSATWVHSDGTTMNYVLNPAGDWLYIQ